VKNHRRTMIRNIRRLVVHGVVFSKASDFVDRVQRLARVGMTLANANGIATKNFSLLMPSWSYFVLWR